MPSLPQSWQQSYDNARAFLAEVWWRFLQDRIPIIAGALSFFTLLSLIPLLLLGISVAAFFVRDMAQVHVYVTSLTSLLGPQIRTALESQVVSVVESIITHRGLLTGVALIFGLWVGSQIFLILEVAINLVWHSTRQRPFWARRGLALLMVLIVGMLLVAAIALTNAIRVLTGLAEPIFGREVNIPLLVATLVSVVMPILLVTSIFTVIFRVLPTKNVTLRTVIPGALFAGVLWSLAAHVFGWYATHVTHYNVFYGSLGSLVLLMFWFYYGTFIMLVGAEISATYHRRLVEAGDREERRVEEHEQIVESHQEWEQFHRHAESARESVVYYGYREME